jgi:ferredoxin
MATMVRNRSAYADRRPEGETPGVDLLRLPLLGRLLRWPWSRVLLQIPLFLLAAVLVLHGLYGPDLAPKNLATLVTWVHYRGFLVLILLVAGNFFCMACPFLLPRELARRLFRPVWNWPRFLRNKWLAVALFVAILFCYELFGLWGEARWTVYLIIAYFAAALVVDALFKHASFCKWVCPIGQFNFLGSALSPLEVKVRNLEVCEGCRTKDCIRGRSVASDGVVAGGEEAKATGEPVTTQYSVLSTQYSAAGQGTGHGPPFTAQPSPLSTEHSPLSDRLSLPVVTQRGCELALFQPMKVGNMDCTFCLDCVYACPHDNIGVVSRLPGAELWAEGSRSGVGKPHARKDLAALVLVFTFGALLNAFGMVSPVYAVQAWLSRVLGTTHRGPILAILFIAGLVIEPVVLLGLAAWIARRLSGRREGLLALATRYAFSLVPLGFGIWLAHYAFHFFTGFLTVIPVTQNALVELGWPILGQPNWNLGGMRVSSVYPLELGFLSLGLIGSWIVAVRLARQDRPQGPWQLYLPWLVLHALLFASAIWLLTQPMEMRGTFLGG